MCDTEYPFVYWIGQNTYNRNPEERGILDITEKCKSLFREEFIAPQEGLYIAERIGLDLV